MNNCMKQHGKNFEILCPKGSVSEEGQGKEEARGRWLEAEIYVTAGPAPTRSPLAKAPGYHSHSHVCHLVRVSITCAPALQSRGGLETQPQPVRPLLGIEGWECEKVGVEPS